MKNIKSITIIFSIIGCLMLSSCATQIGQSTFLSSETLNFVYHTGAKGNMQVVGTGKSIDDAVKSALQKAGNNFDALIDVKIEMVNYSFIVRYRVTGTPVNTSMMKLAMSNNKQFDNYCSTHNYLKPLSD